MVKPKRRCSRVADYVTCFGVAAGAPQVIHGEQIAARHKMRAWLFLNRSPSRRWWYGTRIAIHALSRSVSAACGIVIRIAIHWSRYVIRIAILRSQYNTCIAGPSIAMHRCIVTTLMNMAASGRVVIPVARVRISLCYRFEDWAFLFSPLTPQLTQLYE